MKLVAPPRQFALVFLLFAGLDFIAFNLIASKLGGMASYGYEAPPHYFISFGKGTFVEVSRFTYEYSWWHENIGEALLVLAVLTLALNYFTRGLNL